MIGIVIVSHSRKLADGLQEMAQAMSPASVPIAVAGGVDDPAAPLGTDAAAVKDAVCTVHSNDGVLVFADIGSARLSAAMAIELLEPPAQAKVQLCNAPLVEGVLAAAVQIAAGNGLAQVLAELPVVTQRAPPPTPKAPAGPSRDFTIRNRLGLHARPAALFVQAMNAFAGHIQLINVTKNRPAASAKSINGVMLSEVSQNDVIRIIAPPDNAEAVFAKLDTLIGANFGEAPAISEPPRHLDGVPVAAGYAVGPLVHLHRDIPPIAPIAVSDTKAEITRFRDAVAQAERDILDTTQGVAARLGRYQAKIFDAHIACLKDPEILDAVVCGIDAEQVCAEAVWQRVMGDLAHRYDVLSDPVLRERATDIRDVALHVLRLLTGAPHGALPKTRAIVAFDTMLPSDVLRLEGADLLGMCSATGGKTSHAAILASALPVPVAIGLGPGLAQVAEGQEVALDGGAGRLIVAPGAAERDALREKAARAETHRRHAAKLRDAPARTADGYEVKLAANMASPADLQAILDAGAHEVGLLRTEFLFMNRSAAPDEDEQTQVYSEIAAGLAGRPLTIRTIDIGGDKPVPYLDRPAEANPNLGWRGLRFSLDEGGLFDTQLRAILRASVAGPVRIMFPLVSTLDEVLAAKACVTAAKAALREGAIAFDPQLEVGIMIEVPAAAELAHILAPEVDFFSIGTNDLTQYVMASDRGNDRVQNLFDPFHPAVLRMVHTAITAAHDAGIWIGMCGAMAGNPKATPILLGMGLDEFSMPPLAIPEFKLSLRTLHHAACRDVALHALSAATSREVKDRVDQLLG